jgi:trimeric autotransporter adhesin
MKVGRVDWQRRAARGLRRNVALVVLAVAALLAAGALLFAQQHTGTATMTVGVAPALQLTNLTATTVDLWIRTGTGGSGSLWGDSTSTCTSPITGALTYTSGKYLSIPLSSIPFTTSDNNICAFDPGPPSSSSFLAWPHTATSLAFGQQPTTAASGASISPAVTVKVLDANGKVITSSTASVTIAITSGTPTSGGPGTLSGTTTVNAVNGIATFNNLSINKDGTGYTLTATSGTLTQATSITFNITSGAATKLAYTTVPATGTAGTAFSVTVQSQDASGNPASPTSSTTITLSKASGGGTLSGTLTGTIPTSANSVTISTPVYSMADTMTLTATATAGQTSLTPVTSGNIVFSAGAAAKLAYTTVPTTGTAGTAFSVTVQSQDANGNPASPSSNTTITLSKATGAGTLSGTLAGSILTSGNSVTIATPVYSKADTMTLTATATVGQTSLTPVTSGNIVFSAGAATQLVFTTQPVGGVNPGAALATQPAVEVEDANGNPILSSPPPVTLAISSGTGNSAGTLTCTTNPVTPSTSTGIATFAGCSISASGTGYTLTATTSSPSLTSLASSAFNINGPTKLVFTTEPSGGALTAGACNTFTVTSENASGAATDPTSALTVNLATGSSTGKFYTSSACTTTETSTTIATTASAQNVYYEDTTATTTGYTVTAATTTLPGITTATSNSYTVVAGAATKLVYTTVPSTGTAGTAFSVTVQSQDTSGNPANPTSNTTITLSKATGGGTLSGTLTGTISTSANSVTISTPVYSKSDTMTLTATATAGETSLTAVTSVNIVFSAGAAAKLAFTTQPGGGTGGTTWTTQPVVTVEDANGNTVSSTVAITLAIGTNPSGGTLACTTNPQNATAGVDTFAGCQINKSGNSYTLTATSSALTTATSSAFNITVGAAAQLAFTVQPGGGTGGTAWTTQPVVTVEDAGGNTVTTSTASITLAITSGTPASGGPGTLTCTANPKSATSGVDTFAGCKITTLGTSYTLTATASGLATATSSAFNITVGSATQLAFTSTPITCGYSTSYPCSPEPTVVAEDAGGNIVTTDSSHQVALAGSTNNIHCDQGDPAAMTVVSGVAAFTNCWFNSHTGSETLTATSTGLTSATSAAFTMYSAAANVVFVQQPTTTTHLATITPPVTVQLQDGSGDNVPMSGVSITMSLTTGTGALSGTLTQVTNASGLATFNNLSINLTGSKKLTAASSGLSSATSSTFTIN